MDTTEVVQRLSREDIDARLEAFLAGPFSPEDTQVLQNVLVYLPAQQREVVHRLLLGETKECMKSLEESLQWARAKLWDILAERAYLETVDVSLLDIPLRHVHMAQHARTALVRMGAKNLGDVIRYTEQDVLGVRNAGVATVEHIRRMLKNEGLALRSEWLQ